MIQTETYNDRNYSGCYTCKHYHTIQKQYNKNGVYYCGFGVCQYIKIGSHKKGNKLLHYGGNKKIYDDRESCKYKNK